MASARISADNQCVAPDCPDRTKAGQGKRLDGNRGCVHYKAFNKACFEWAGCEIKSRKPAANKQRTSSKQQANKQQTSSKQTSKNKKSNLSQRFVYFYRNSQNSSYFYG